MATTRWEQAMADPLRWQGYADKFAQYHADGTDLDGEARFVDMLAGRESTILDAGCGPGRVAAGLRVRGHDAVGVDKDAGLLADGRVRYPGVPLVELDLVELTPESLQDNDLPSSFDVIVSPGNVLVYVAPGSERQIVQNLAAVLRPGGRAVFGFATDREYTVDQLDADAASVGWRHEFRLASWHLDPWMPDSDWAVSVYRADGDARPVAGPDGIWAPVQT